MNRYKPLFSEYDDNQDTCYQVYRFRNNYGLIIMMKNYKEMSGEWFWDSQLVRFITKNDHDFKLQYDETLCEENLEEHEVEEILELVEQLPRHDFNRIKEVLN